MSRDKLFLLKGDFLDKGEGPFYCPECAELHGVLHFFPALQEQLDVQYVDFTRPRLDVVRELGIDNQSCPVLVVNQPNAEACEGLDVKDYKGRKFIAGAQPIGKYLARAYKISRPH